MCFRPSKKLSKPVVYGFDVDETQSQLIVTGDAFELRPDAALEPDLSLSANGEQYLLFTYGRLTAEDGIHLGRLSVTGEISHLDQFEAWFKGL